MTDVAPVSVCIIVKNEGGQFENCLKSIRPYVAEICIVDTGSSDSTPSIAKSYADKFEIFTECNDDHGLIASFSVARQRSYELGTKPWSMWVDGDDEVFGAENLLSIINKHDRDRNEFPKLVMFPYEYAYDECGNVICRHMRERLTFPRGKFHWHGPVHEVLIPDHPETISTQSDSVIIKHRRDSSQKIMESGRNLRILKAYYEKMGESDIRMLYYLGLEYGNAGDLDNAIKFHKRYIELSGWDDEKFLACLKVAEHYQVKGDYDNALNWGLKSLTIREGWGESYFSIGRSYYLMAQNNGSNTRRNWMRSIHFFRQGLACPPTQTILFTNPIERSYEIQRYLNYALNNIGDIKGALESVNTALRIRPDDEGLKLNKRLYSVHLAKVNIIESLKTLSEYDVIESGIEKQVNDIIEGRIVVKSKTSDTSQRIIRSSSCLDIVFYVGYSCERWNPETAKTSGIGGSETAIIEMAKRLVTKGHKVRVFGDCPDSFAGVFDGVEYIHYTSFKNIECDIFISSRRPQVVDDEFNIKTGINLCWVHDVHCGAALTHKRALRFDKFLCLSEWHKSYFMGVHKCVHPDQIIVTRNGIVLDKFRSELNGNSIIRNPHRAVYSSSPDRGLELAIKVWPRIRHVIPDAELHVFYGFKNWEVCARAANDIKQLKQISYLRDMLNEAKEYGVYYHDRVDQYELARQFMCSGIWAYPTWFAETSCITAMEAQAAGLKIVTSPIAALNETVGSRGVMIHGDWFSEAYASNFTDAVIEAMQKGDDAEVRSDLRKYAFEHFGWDGLANDWEVMFKQIIKETERNIVVPYQRSV